MVLFLSPLAASFTEPSAIEYLLPWQSQLMVPPLTEARMQPWWVQTASNALNEPAVRWVTTTLRSAWTRPPSAWMALLLISPEPRPLPVLGVLLPQAARAAATPTPAAPARTARRDARPESVVVSLIRSS